MKCPIDDCKATANSDTTMYQHVNKMHRGSTYKPQYEPTEADPKIQAKIKKSKI